MKRGLLFFGAGVLLSAAVCAAGLPFPAGEELIYSISWNGIPVAWSRAVAEPDVFEGREVLALRLTTRTYPFFNKIYEVDDFHESLVDPKTLLPVRYTKNLREGRYRCHEITTLDHAAGTARYVHQVSGNEKTYIIEPDTRDILSFMYFMRSERLEESAVTRYRVMSDEKIYDLILTAFKAGRIELPQYKRKVESLEIEPEAMFDGLFVRKGKATVWVSRDPRRLLTFAKIGVPFGRVRVTLQEVGGPGDDFWIAEKENGD